jgi:histidine ammonia-lyase
MQRHPISIQIDGSLTLDSLQQIAEGASVNIPKEAKKQITESHKVVKKFARCKAPVYGVNTGFGFFANQRISLEELKVLQHNLLKSHASGYGAPLSIPETRAAMALRLNVLVKGFTGVRFELCEALLKLINAHIHPFIPTYGSVGASGDLAPLAHLALPLIGEGWVFYKNKKMEARFALQKAGLKPIQLMEKEGLSLINGTQIMLAIGSLALIEAFRLMEKSDQAAALSFEGLAGHTDALDPRIHSVRQQQGQIQSAEAIREQLSGSYLYDPALKRKRVQDPYSLRCAPQIHGPSRDALTYVRCIVERELNAVTDNPLIFVEDEAIVSGGNFHGQALAMAFDFASIAIAELGNVSDRRLELLMNPHLSGLPAFLSPNEGLNSGYMALQYLSASLVNENKILAHPACTDSIPGNVGIEDHVSMGMTSARKLKQIIHNVTVIIAIEMLAAAQAIDLREAGPLGKGTQQTYKAIRRQIETLTEDRIVAVDVEKAVEIFKQL